MAANFRHAVNALGDLMKMAGTRAWLGANGVLTAFAVSPYITSPAQAVRVDGIALVGPDAAGRIAVAFAWQGIAMGLYCLWGAVQPRRTLEALRFLVLYMTCIVIGRAMAAFFYAPAPAAKSVTYLVLDAAITLVSAWLLYRNRGNEPLATQSTA